MQASRSLVPVALAHDRLIARGHSVHYLPDPDDYRWLATASYDITEFLRACDINMGRFNELKVRVFSSSVVCDQHTFYRQLCDTWLAII